MKANICKDRGRPGCLGTPDPRYEMRFDDIGEDPIQFCAHCGPEALAINALIEKAFVERPGFAEDFKAAIERHEKMNPTFPFLGGVNGDDEIPTLDEENAAWDAIWSGDDEPRDEDGD